MNTNEQRGFILIEFLVAIAVLAVIALGGGMTTVQVIEHSQSNRDHLTTARQAQNVGYRVSQDIPSAKHVSTTDAPETAEVEFITLTWKDLESGQTHDIRYIWIDSSDSFKKVKRKHMVRDENGLETSNSTLLVADNIYSANLTQQGSGWKLTVEAVSGEKSSVKEYEIHQRLE